jgi:hypothetical protein
MATVEITAVQDLAPNANGSVPIRIEISNVPDDDSTEFYSDLEIRGPREWAAKAGVQTTRQIYAEAIEMACAVAAQTARRLAGMDAADRPDEFEVEFALSIGLSGDAKLVSVNSDAQVQVRMQWNRRTGE